MKTILTTAFLLFNLLLYAQNNDFLNNGGDLLWSNPNNWSEGVVPNTTNTDQVRLPLTLESLVDVDVTIKKIQTTFATSGDAPLGGPNTLTIDPGANNQQGIENVSNSDIKLIFKGNVNINNSAGGFTLMRSLNGSSNSIDFDTGSTLSLTTNLATLDGSSGDFNYNGSITGSGNLRLGPNTINVFGNNSVNPSWNGDLVFLFNSQAVVNTADNSIFYDGTKLQVNGGQSSIEINGRNVFYSNITIGGSNIFTFDADADQNDMGQIIFSNNGTLNLDVDSSVTELNFNDNSSSNWNSGSLNITGFREGIIRFGTTDTGLTSQQLSQISADNGGKTLTLDADGYLVNVPDYSYSSGSWLPSNPVGSSINTDNILIENGTADISGALTANNVRVAPGASLNITSSGILDLSGDIINRGSLTFKSNNAGSGQIDEFTGIVLDNSITTERFIPAGDNNRRAFRFLSSSVTSTTSIRDNWQEGASSNTDNPAPGFGTHITGATTDGMNGFDGTISGNPSLLLFDNDTQTWGAIDNTDVITLETGSAYNLFVRGDRSIDLTSDSQTPTNTSLRATGSLDIGNVDLSADIASGNNEWSLIGNPYQAIVDFNALTFSGDIRTTFFYEWDPNASTNGAYSLKDNSDTAQQMIQPGQSFFVQNSGSVSTAPGLQFTEAEKNTSGTVTSVFDDSQITTVDLMLYNTNNIKLDVMKFRFEAGANNTIDDLDAGKLQNPNENIASSNSNMLFALELRDIPQQNEIVSLFLNQYQFTQYEFRLNTMNWDEDIDIYIVDNYLNTSTLIDEDQVFSFNVDSSIPESIASDRFDLMFDNTSLGVNDSEFGEGISLFPNPTNNDSFSIKTQNINADDVEIRIYNLMGKQVMNQVHKLDLNGYINVDVKNLSSGVYMVELSHDRQNFTTKLIVH